MQDTSSWHEYINHKVRQTYLAVLNRISRTEVPAVVVGSGALLARCYYQKNYWWDIDILFPDVESLESFSTDMRNAENLNIEFVDEELQKIPELYSLHTLWSYKNRQGIKSGWVNVDMIVRRDYDWYSFHSRMLEKQGRFVEEVECGGETFPLNLSMAHPWGIFIEKILSPRLMKELATEDNYSYDARDIFTILEKDGKRPDFKRVLLEVLHNRLIDPGLFRERFTQIIYRKNWLGYGYQHIPKDLLESLLIAL